MPISQDRMLALIRTANHYRAELNALIREILAKGEAAIAGTGDPKGALIALYDTANLITIPEDILRPLFKEEQHFHDTAYRNDLNKLRMQRLRGRTDTGLGEPRRYRDHGATPQSERRTQWTEDVRAQALEQERNNAAAELAKKHEAHKAAHPELYAQPTEPPVIAEARALAIPLEYVAHAKAVQRLNDGRVLVTRHDNTQAIYDLPAPPQDGKPLVE